MTAKVLSLYLTLVIVSMASMALAQTPMDGGFTSLQGSLPVWGGVVISVIFIIAGLLMLGAQWIGPQAFVVIVFALIAGWIIGLGATGRGAQWAMSGF